jgi:hypothetical protein
MGSWGSAVGVMVLGEFKLTLCMLEGEFES